MTDAKGNYFPARLVDTMAVNCVPNDQVFTIRNQHGMETPVIWRNNRLYIFKGGLGTGHTGYTRQSSFHNFELVKGGK